MVFEKNIRKGHEHALCKGEGLVFLLMIPKIFLALTRGGCSFASWNDYYVSIRFGWGHLLQFKKHVGSIIIFVFAVVIFRKDRTITKLCFLLAFVLP